MLQLSRKLFLILLMVPLFVTADEGTGDGGGDYQFYRSGVHTAIKRAQKSLLTLVQLTPQEALNGMFTPFSVEKNKLIQILQNVKINIQAPAKFRTTPHGYTDRILIDYVVSESGEKGIEFLLPFLEEAQDFLDRADTSLNRLSREEILEFEIRRRILHEALHHFGIINDDLTLEYSLNHVLLGFPAQEQINACQTIRKESSKTKCFEAWTPEYKAAMNDYFNWTVKQMSQGTISFYVADHFNIKIDLSKKYYATLNLNNLMGDVETKCFRENHLQTRCEPKRLRQNGRDKPLLSHDRKNIFIVKDTFVDIDDAFIKTPLVLIKILRGQDPSEDINLNEHLPVILMESEN